MYLAAKLPLQILKQRPIFGWFLTRVSSLLFVLLSGRVRRLSPLAASERVTAAAGRALSPPIRPLPGERVNMTKVAACDYYVGITSH
jgi:hypothetical protein